MTDSLRPWRPLGRRPRQPLDLRLTPLELVTLVLEGDLTLMPQLHAVPHEVLVIDCAAATLRVQPEVVADVLARDDDEPVEAWVFFVREGHCDKPSRPVAPLAIDTDGCWALDAYAETLRNVLR